MVFDSPTPMNGKVVPGGIGDWSAYSTIWMIARSSSGSPAT